jgi:nicotinamide phosphoribosyltransferase
VLDRNEFLKGAIPVPWPVRGDAYTVSSDRIVSKAAKAKSVYNFTNRRSPMDSLPRGVAKDSRMVLYGLTDFIRRELTTPVPLIDVALSNAFVADGRIDGGRLDFDHEMWIRVARDWKYLPIRIEALPEGSTFWPNEPVIQVTSLDEGFGEIAAIVEALLVGYVANATARLTLTRHLLERIRDVVRKHNPSYTPEQVDELAQTMIHDFGMRASSTPQEAEIYGRAHLLCFNGTDTTSAAYQAWATGAKRPIGTTILALAHRIVMGHAHETDAYEAMAAATEGCVGSYVADCYDFHAAVSKFLTSVAKRGGRTVVARPDSGDYLENVLFVVDQALKHDLYRTDETGKPAATSLRFIQGDSMNWEKIEKVFMALERKEVNPTQWGIFGVGGWLRTTPTRDIFSSAYKLAAFGNPLKPCVKLSDTLAKVSVPGPSLVLRPNRIEDGINGPTVFFEDEFRGREEEIRPESGHDYNALMTFYDGSKRGPEAFSAYCLEDFNTHRDRCLREFDAYKGVAIDRGLPTNPVLSRRVQKFQQDTMRKYGKTLADYVF